MKPFVLATATVALIVATMGSQQVTAHTSPAMLQGHLILVNDNRKNSVPQQARRPPPARMPMPQQRPNQSVQRPMPQQRTFQPGQQFSRRPGQQMQTRFQPTMDARLNGRREHWQDWQSRRSEMIAQAPGDYVWNCIAESNIWNATSNGSDLDDVESSAVQNCLDNTPDASDDGSTGDQCLLTNCW
jgi:hypothetical protein